MFFYATDGYLVYPHFIDETDHIVSKTYIAALKKKIQDLGIIFHT